MFHIMVYLVLEIPFFELVLLHLLIFVFPKVLESAFLTSTKIKVFDYLN